MGIDKAVRWENVDLAKAGLSKGDLNEMRAVLQERQRSANAFEAPRLKQAIRRINLLLNAPKPKKPKMKLGGLPTESGSIGRFSGGMGTASFVRGGSPGSKR